MTECVHVHPDVPIRSDRSARRRRREPQLALAPGNVILLTSPWKAGKPTLLTGLLRHLGTGDAFLERPCRPAKAMVVSEGVAAALVRSPEGPPDRPAHALDHSTIRTTPEGEQLKALLPKFLGKKRCFDAFMGYSRNQEKKFRDSGQVIDGGKDRKWKYASAHVRTLYQLLRLLKTGELRGTYPGGVTEELRAVKEGRVLERDVMSRIFELEGLCREAFETTSLPEKPDEEAIEGFVLDVYSREGSQSADPAQLV